MRTAEFIQFSFVYIWYNLILKNFIIFKADGSLEYKFNNPSSETGSYKLTGDSVHATIGNKKYIWDIELLIKTNFNVRHSEKGGVGITVDTYQSFIK